MRTKTFDCVRMKDEIQEEIYRAIKGLPPEQQVASYQEAITADAELRDKFSRILPSPFPMRSGPVEQTS